MSINLNEQMKINNFTATMDPLEQFNFFEIFVHNFEEIEKFNLLKDKCPFNIHKMAYNLFFTVDYF